MKSAQGFSSEEKDFMWGVSTSAFQIEGAMAVDGRAPSIWDEYALSQIRREYPSIRDVGVDDYFRFEEDLDYAKDLGVSAYRFSVAWPRVFPEGNDEPNPLAIDHYQRVVEAVHARGMTPIVTLYHWDLPLWVQDKGGWPARSTVDAFGRFAEVIGSALGGRVQHWLTINEPGVTAWFGHYAGLFAPFERSYVAALRTHHHLLLAHASAFERIKRANPASLIGLVLNNEPMRPTDKDPKLIEVASTIKELQTEAFLEPILNGCYPETFKQRHYPLGSDTYISPGDLITIHTGLDWLGVNYFRPNYVGHRGSGRPLSRWFPKCECADTVMVTQEITETGWEIDPKGIHETLLDLSLKYPKIPMVVTENGAAFPDDEEGDRRRSEYLRSHVEMVLRARREGVHIHGYFVWSLLDSYEWGRGLKARFGLVGIDYPTLNRRKRGSYETYKGLINAHRIEMLSG